MLSKMCRSASRFSRASGGGPLLPALWQDYTGLSPHEQGGARPELPLASRSRTYVSELDDLRRGPSLWLGSTAECPGEVWLRLDGGDAFVVFVQRAGRSTAAG